MHKVTQDDLDRYTWFHGIDFGNGLSVKGRIPENQPQNYTLFGIYSFLEHIDLQGQRALDIGTMDRLMAFILKKMGAASVVATDLVDGSYKFNLARKALGFEHEIEYRGSLDIENRASVTSVLGDERFDLVNFTGVLYHLLGPLEGLIACRELLRSDGLICVGTLYDGISMEPVLRFNMGALERVENESTTYFLPTLPALLAMLRTAAFDPLVAIRLRPGHSWVNVLARAVRPSGVRDRTPLQRLHDSEDSYPNHHVLVRRFRKFEHAQAMPSSIRWTGKEGFDHEIDIYKYRPAVPFQPRYLPK